MLPLIVVTIVNIVSVPLFYRYLGAEMYALWLYVLTFAGTFGIMDLGLGTAVGRYIGVSLGKGDGSAVRAYWGTGNAIVIPVLLTMACVFIAIGVFFGPKWFNVSPEYVYLLRWSFVAGGAGLALTYYGQFWLILSQAHLDFRFIGILRIVITLLQIVPSIFLAWLTRSPLVLIVWAGLVSIVQFAVFAWHARRAYALSFNFGHANWQCAREMAAYTSKVSGTLLVATLLGSIDRLLFGKFAPPEVFAHYSIAANAGARIQGVGQAVIGPVFSNTSRAVGGGGGSAIAKVFNETFDFLFPWFVLASVWTFIWHPVLLRLWIGSELGAEVSPFFTPIIIACCFTSLANISGAQLGPLNRMGAYLNFIVVTGLLLVGCVYVGWITNGAVGVAWGFLASRVGCIAQDLYVIRKVGAGGWLAKQTWLTVIVQCLLGILFMTTFLFLPPTSYWTLVPAGFHGFIVAAWLMRIPLRRALARGPFGTRFREV